MEVLPLGTIVRLKKGTQKLMIITRMPLYNNQGTIGYFDYAGCLYPNGETGQVAYFFNAENIEEIFFKGYIDESEKKFLQMYEKQIENIKYPKLKLKDKEKDTDGSL